MKGAGIKKKHVANKARTEARKHVKMKHVETDNNKSVKQTKHSTVPKRRNEHEGSSSQSCPDPGPREPTPPITETCLFWERPENLSDKWESLANKTNKDLTISK